MTTHANHLRMVFHPLGARRWIVSWDQVARHLLTRAERELSESEDDDQATALLIELRGYESSSPRGAARHCILPSCTYRFMSRRTSSNSASPAPS